MSTKKLQILGSLFKNVYLQNDEPIDAPNGSLWVDLDESNAASIPAVSVTQTNSGADIVCTDQNGTTTAKITHGRTPIKGVDYYTESDKSNFVQEVIENLLDSGDFSAYYYASLSDAVNASNSDDFSQSASSSEANVGVIRYGPSVYRIDLLNDITETTTIAVSCNIYLSLNGKTLTFNEGGLTFNEGIYCTIDGRVAGSSVIKNSSLTGSQFMLASNAKELNIYGGVYSGTATNANAFYTIRVGTNIPEFWNSLSSEEKNKWLIDNKNELSKVYIDGCDISGYGAVQVSAILNSMGYIKCKNSSFEASGSSGFLYALANQAGYTEVEDCQFTVNSDKKVRLDCVYLIKGSIFYGNRLNISVNVSSSSMTEVCGILTSSGAIAELDNSTIEINAPNTSMPDTQGIGTISVILVDKDFSIKNSTVRCNIIEYNRSHLIQGYGEFVRIEIDNCYLETPTEIIFASDNNSKVSAGITNSTIKTYRRGICNFKDDVNCFYGDSFLKDCTIITGSLSGLTSSESPLNCGNIHGPLYLDSCTIEVADDVPTIFDIHSTGDLSMSNCTITKTGSQKISMESSSKLNIGVGCNITEDMINGTASFTNELYRHVEDADMCSGKDLKVYYDYITKSIAGQLSSIVDGGVG